MRLLLVLVNVFFVGLVFIWGLLFPALTLTLAWFLAALISLFWAVTPLEVIGLLALCGIAWYAERVSLRSYFAHRLSNLR